MAEFSQHAHTLLQYRILKTMAEGPDKKNSQIDSQNEAKPHNEDHQGTYVLYVLLIYLRLMTPYDVYVHCGLKVYKKNSEYFEGTI